MTLINKIVDHTKESLDKKIEIGNVETTPKTILLRLFVYSITFAWISFYPLYLLAIHMHVEGFFSYDIFVNGIFGVNAFFIFMLVLIILAGFYCWGFLVILRSRIGLIIKFIFVPLMALISLGTHWLLISGSMKTENFIILFGVSGAGFLIVLILTSYLENPISKALNNWAGPLLFIGISASMPLVSKEGISEAVKVGLSGFGVGGNKVASVRRIDTDEVLVSGKLLLLTPNYIYLRKGEHGYQSISRSNQSYIDVE